MRHTGHAPNDPLAANGVTSRIDAQTDADTLSSIMSAAPNAASNCLTESCTVGHRCADSFQPDQRHALLRASETGQPVTRDPEDRSGRCATPDTSNDDPQRHRHGAGWP